MYDAFLSYSRRNTRYISLVKRMLEFHRISTWVDTNDIRAGANYKVELDRAINSAECLLVLITEDVARSQWVAREITSFRAARPDARIIPLLFADVDPELLFEGLGDYQAISFVEDLDAGFAALIGELGRPYLPLVDHRTGKDRRDVDRREGDRRQARLEQRLRMGMWKNFAAVTALSEFEEFGASGPPSAGDHKTALPRTSALYEFGRPSPASRASDRTTSIARLAEVFAAPNSELSRYIFRDPRDGREVVLDSDYLRVLVYGVCRHLETFGQLLNVYVVERLAETLLSTFEVEPRDRRKGDRRAQADRRTPPH